jgi:O-antigen ligase
MGKEPCGVSLGKFPTLTLHPSPDWGPIGVCAYIAGFGVPLKWDVPLMVLALCGLLATGLTRRDKPPAASLLVFPVLGFLIATGLSILVSGDPGRSARLSSPLLPGALLFLLISQHFHSTRHVRALYLTLSVVALALASALLWTGWRAGRVTPGEWISELGSPILVVPNDVTFLALVAPISLVLLYREPRSAVGALAALSLLSGVCAMGLLRSRVAVLTAVVSVSCAATLLRPRLGLACGPLILILALMVDGFLGFPMVAKFSETGVGGRINLWSAAWDMFLAAPLLGHGAHTFTYSEWPRTVPWAHNLYLEALAEQGIVGLAALGSLLVCGVLGAWRIQRAAVSEARILGAGAFAGLTGFCFAAAFELSLLRLWIVVMLFGLLGVIAQLSPDAASRPACSSGFSG